MKTDRVDHKMAELLEAARPEMSEGWDGRACEAVARVRPGRGSRLRWVPTALGTALVIAALALAPYSAGAPGGGSQTAFAAQEALAAAAGGEMPEADTSDRAKREDLPEPLGEYAERAPAFVQEHCPDDPEMLIAAGLLTRDLSEARELLKSAVENGGSGAAWAAYAQTVMELGPGYGRPGTRGVDPGEPEAVAEAESGIADKGLAQRLTPEEAEPVLDVLRQWQKVESDNALPLALEMYYLYGLHRDQEALVRWEEAAALPEVNTHAQEFIWHTGRLLERMGMSPWESVSNSYSASDFRPLSKLRTCARIGVYEGRLAEMEGRGQEAIRWWMATFRFGEHMQKSADTMIEALVGIAIEGVGGTPVWTWQVDRATGIADGPLLKGRLFYGKAHAFFVKEAGQQAAEEMRDSLARAKMRSMLSRQYVERLGPTPMLEVVTLRSFAGMSVLLLLAALLEFGVVSLWARRKADEATMLGWRGRVALALISLAPLAVGSALSFGALEKNLVSASLGMLGGAAVSFLLLLILPFAAAFRSRTPEAGVLTAWRGNLRRVLPLAVVGFAIISLGFVMASRTAEARWARDWPSRTEMERVLEALGPEWHAPPIPADAWRNEPPPEAKGG